MIDIVIVGDMNEITKDAISSLKNSHYDNPVYVVPFDGYNKSLNNGARKGKSEFIAFCNNDLLFRLHWDRVIVDELERCKNTDIVSASPWCPLTHKQWWTDGKPKINQIGTRTGFIVAGWCLVLRRSWWEEMKGFDERLRFWCCDNSYTMQLEQAKKNHILVVDSEVTHLQSVTLNMQDKATYDDLTKMEVKRFNTYYDQNLFNWGKI